MRDYFEATVGAALNRIRVQRGEMILLAISGGADSVALFHSLIALRDPLGLRLAAAHLNHHLRGAESGRDEAFVRALCAERAVEATIGHARGLDGPNLEERAREQRYGFLWRTADALGATRIALGHHGDDQAETVLLRLLRGTGVSGLTAMAEAGPGKLIRPMLCLTRAEIVDYLNKIGAHFVVDSTNASNAVLRNRVRSALIPLLERDYTPGLSRRLRELASEMRSIDDLMTRLAGAELDRAVDTSGALDLRRFATLHPALAAAVIRGFVRVRSGSLRRMTRAHIEAIRSLCINGPSNGSIDLPGGWRAERQYSLLRLHDGRPPQPREFSVALALEGMTTVVESGYRFDAAIVDVERAAQPRSQMEALFDADQIGEGLTARSFARGDRIRPLGMWGTRKVKDVFIDHKVARSRRPAHPLVVAGGEVLWIPGLVRGRGALIGARTSRVVRVTANLRWL